MATEDQIETLNFSGKGLKKINKATENEAKCLVTLILDDNELQRLDYVDSYSRLEHLSASKNGLLRMHGVSRLLSLRELCLSHNSILTIEGLKELVYLKKLILSGNNIKSIEHLNNNNNLEHLDLSDNQISHISDISYLKNLKHLNLDRNRFGNLKQCERYLPSSLISFGISNNFITDLNTLCHISHLESLERFNIEGNPCVTPTDNEKLNFDYRPFVINWVMNVKVLDGYEVNAIESLKAEWLYSQGKGRQFREGEHALLIQYLATTCPSGAAAPETEEQRKLRLILSKAQHHQQQLREQGPSSPRLRQSPRMNARITGRITKSPDRAMSSSYHSALSNKHHSLLAQSSQMSASFSGEIPSNTLPRTNHPKIDSIMSQSFDLSNSLQLNTDSTDNKVEAKKQSNEIDKKPRELIKPAEDSNKALNQPLEAASKMVPVPDSMMSPDYQGPAFVPPPGMINQLNKRNIPVSNFQTSSPMPSKGSVTNSVALSQTASYCEPSMANKNGKALNKSAPSMIVAKPIAPIVKNTKGSPQLPRSAMSSPKMRHCTEKRKGSFSSRPVANNHEELNSQSLKCYNSASAHTSNGGSINYTKSSEMSSSKATNGTSKAQTDDQVTPPNTHDGNTSDDDSEMYVEKLKSIRDAANQRRKKQSISDSGSSENVASSNKLMASKNKSAYNAAVIIQKLWRGYRTRNLSQKTGSVLNTLQMLRARQYIEKLTNDIESTKAALDSDRKIQQFQMQAISALWKKISAMEGESKTKDSDEKDEDKESKDVAVRELTQTCNTLQAQIQQLQGSMRDILQFVSHRNASQADQWSDGIATQTDITAVHTPQGESTVSWPFQKMASRPCTLHLSVQNSNFNQTNVNGKKDVSHVEVQVQENLPGQADTGGDNPKKASDSVEAAKEDVKNLNGDCHSCKLTEDLISDCLGSSANCETDAVKS